MSTRKRSVYSFFIGLIIIGYTWVVLILLKVVKSELIICPIKTITGFSCPSCGSTRAVLKIIQGDFSAALHTNPFGFLLFFLALICPLWLLYDFIYKKESLWIFYNRLESVINKKIVAIPLILIVMANWIWNISKGL